MGRARFNPFPGLRPFEADEDHLFFGREKETDELLRRLRTTRFLSVIGTSGTGKSSLVRSGLIPSLLSGFMVAAGSSWRIAVMRPGEDPIGNLATALDAPEVLAVEGELEATNRVLIEATLRRSSLGLVNAFRQADLPAHENLLVVVDQFEELFRFQRNREIANSRDESVAFLKLLLDASRQCDLPIYVVSTMRSDFIGDCIRLPGLTEAVNAGQYLVPRMTREELRSAITGPVAVGGGAIAPRLVLRILNDLGDDADELPVLQHALMRTWDHWARHADDGRPMDVPDYEAVGTLSDALSRHAEEAYDEAGSAHARLAERIFKALTDRFTDQRGVRRPTSIEELAAICEAPEPDVVHVVEAFRRPGRSFLMPPSPVPLEPHSIVDISHESLMRCWTRLIGWAEEERQAATFYARLSQASRWYEEGTAGPWRDPELALGIRWREDNHPTASWAARYDDGFGRAMGFLAASESERDRLAAEAARQQRRQLTLARTAATVLGVLLVAALAAAYVAVRETRRAESNFALARTAVDQTLASVEVDPARMGADLPQVEEFRRGLLERTKRFYGAFIAQKPDSREIYVESAFARFRIGHIDRMLGRVEEASREYSDAIAALDRLAREHPGEARYRDALGDAWNWLGETLRPVRGRGDEAGAAYDRALELQEALVREAPGNADYGRRLARTHGNRGILRSARSSSVADAAFRSAERDFRRAIELLEPLAARATDRTTTQELARAHNNLASLVSLDDARLQEARAHYEHAIALDEEVARAEPENRQNALELAKLCNNLAGLLHALGDDAGATNRNARALDLLNELARPTPSVGVEIADTHSLRGRLLHAQGDASAVGAYEEAVRRFETLLHAPAARRSPELHLRYEDLLLNLAILSRDRATSSPGRALLSRALDVYLQAATGSAAEGATRDATAMLDALSRLGPELPEVSRRELSTRVDEVRRRLAHPQGP
jgi:tetratricopeptide (TPR) repeat protein